MGDSGPGRGGLSDGSVGCSQFCRPAARPAPDDEARHQQRTGRRDPKRLYTPQGTFLLIGRSQQGKGTVAFILPFETDIIALDDELAALEADDPKRADLQRRLREAECAIYRNLNPYETFLLSAHPQRPKTLDYIRHMFSDVVLFENPDVRGDHLMIGGQAKLELEDGPIDVIVVGQQTAPTSDRDELLKLPKAEYQKWNQGMGFPDSYRKAVYCMNLAEERGWPVIVFVDTPGADPSEYSEEQGQAFAINEVIRKTTSLRVPNLSYIISQGASGGAIAITPTNRTIMNEYASYMVISPGGCASILFRNREPESIRTAAEGLHLTSKDALAQGTVDDVVPEGCTPGHRYPKMLLEAGKIAIQRNVQTLLDENGAQPEETRRAKFFAMGVYGTSDETRTTAGLAEEAQQQRRAQERVERALTEYLVERGGLNRANGEIKADEAERLAARMEVAQLIYAIDRFDAGYLEQELGVDATPLTKTQWLELKEFVFERRYGHAAGVRALHPTKGERPYRRLHPLDWIRKLTDAGTFREFEETLRLCSVDQLDFPQYQEALERGIKSTGLHTGVVTGTTNIDEHHLVLTMNNFGLVGSSLCDEIGEKMRYAAHYAMEHTLPLVSISMGGGARMQEGTPSMHRNIPKAQHALNEMYEAGLPHISVIADPTLGGTAISYGLRGDYMIVLKGSANIGFSGKRVVEQFQQKRVASDFQHETWLLQRGFVDETVTIDALRDRLIELLAHYDGHGSLTDLQRRIPRRWQPLDEQEEPSAPLPQTTVSAARSARA